ncbi:Hypothetical protein SRAE_2000219000 [Strongyloides ratti]|uniref:Uncharacterized protein n=1 Tax=Strongyloides ratti TaxID=34506 RepID=A0A090LHB8_STRRB|nr:Hypothetical protein SRAE_2000219000 [Strongyloides ratti]CEF67528.1 Hypothetical protein SRAE_2000219000 [Strongyloides ratti]
MDTGNEIRKILEVTRIELTHHAENDNKHGIVKCLERLQQLLGNDVEEAVKLVNDGFVNVIQDKKSGRKVVRVSSRKSSKFYYLFPLINYCHCSQYQEFVINTKLKFMVCFD